MTKNETKPTAGFKLLLAVPAIIIAIVLFACQDDPDAMYQRDMQTLDDKNPVSQFLSGSDLYQQREKMIYIADGKEISLSSALSLEDVASISWLSGRVGIERYGERGSEGVIEISTSPPESDEIKRGEESITEEEEAFVIVEEMPKFRGGDLNDFNRWAGENINYPEEALSRGIEGTVFIKFVIERDGSVNNIEVVRSVHRLLDSEAVRVVESSPVWEPGRQRGREVRVQFILPIEFTR